MQDGGRNGRQVMIADVGNSNLSRLKYALQSLGHTPVEASTGSAIAEAPLAIITGSGDLNRSFQHIRNSGLAEGLSARAQAKLPTLAIGLGALIYCEGFADGQFMGAGLGYLPGIVRRLPDQGIRGETLINPHLGWSDVEVLNPSPLLSEGAAFYFAHERVIDAGARWGDEVMAQAHHTLVFPAIVRRDALIGVQFHPELSGASGLKLLSAFCAPTAS